MSAFREWLEALGRITRLAETQRSQETQESPVLADEPGPALLRWDLARLLPLAALVQADTAGRRRVAGELHGRQFVVWFPAASRQPAGHTWALALWNSEDSGTHRPEALGVCVTCTAPSGSPWPGPSVVVGPARCVLDNLGRG